MTRKVIEHLHISGEIASPVETPDGGILARVGSLRRAVFVALNDHKLETLLTGKTPMYFAPVFRHERLEIQAHQTRRQGL